MEPCSAYRPRDASASPLYRVVLEHVETFVAEVRRDSPAGPFAEAALRAFLECGIPRFGLARFRCAKCDLSRFVPFSCKRRAACPSCDAKRAVVESSRALAELLPHVPYRQWVLVLPKRLRWFVNRDARLAGEVARILGSVLTQRLQRRSGAPQGAAPAQLHAIQRFGSSVNLHIHDHAVVSDGAFAVGGGVLRFYPASAPSPEELEELTQRLRRRILRRMKGAVPEAAILDMLAWPHSGFSLDASVRIEAHDRTALGRLLRYVLRPALSLKKLSYDAAEGVVRYRPGKEGLPWVLTWPALQFMERFAAIIPPPRKHLVRYYGALGPRSKLRRALTAGTRAQASFEELTAGFPVAGLIAAARGLTRAVRAAVSKASRAWAACIRRVFEVDPVRCEGCGGEMELVAVITKDSEVDRLLGHLGLPRVFPKNKPARAPPLPFGGEGCQLDGFEGDGRQSWPSGSGAQWPA
ncbi:MAG: putative transposase [Elusimicrobia bacterium]|nr:MAG: putative transposase [Elusimicrobiota bacterium]